MQNGLSELADDYLVVSVVLCGLRKENEFRDNVLWLFLVVICSTNHITTRTTC